MTTIREFNPYLVPATTGGDNGTTSEWFYPYEHERLPTTTVVNMVIGILVCSAGTFTNAILFVFLFLTKSGRRLLPSDIHYVFLALLNIADLIFSAKILAFISIGFGTGYYLSHIPCWTYAALSTLLPTGSFGLLALLSLERYYKVVKLQHRTYKFWLIASIPLILHPVGIPALVFAMDLHHEYWTLWDGIGYCMVRYDSRKPIHMVISLIGVLFMSSCQTIMIHTNTHLIRQVLGVKTALIEVIVTTLNPNRNRHTNLQRQRHTILATVTGGSSQDPLQSSENPSTNTGTFLTVPTTSTATSSSPSMPMSMPNVAINAPTLSAVHLGDGSFRTSVILKDMHVGSMIGSSSSFSTAEESVDTTVTVVRDSSIEGDSMKEKSNYVGFPTTSAITINESHSPRRDLGRIRDVNFNVPPRSPSGKSPIVSVDSPRGGSSGSSGGEMADKIMIVRKLFLLSGTSIVLWGPYCTYALLSICGVPPTNFVFYLFHALGVHMVALSSMINPEGRS
ncbi:hypothetical protein HK102_013569 [Quaeritorhiza haematococci]|nr:hypothetical protein HK102_013569 [Quaeritorhiza haematococci]